METVTLTHKYFKEFAPVTMLKSTFESLTQDIKENYIVMKRFFFSAKQKYYQQEYKPFHKCEVWMNGHWVEYTEMTCSRNSNWDDGDFLGVFPEWNIRINGVIQNKDLK